MEFTSELLQALAKRAWKLSWILVVNIIIAVFVILLIVINEKLYILSNISKIDDNMFSLLEFFLQSFFLSIIIFTVFYVLKGDSDLTIKKLREKYYYRAIERVKLVFNYRFDFPLEQYTEEIKELIEYKNAYTKGHKQHIIEIKHLQSYIVDGVDSLYFKYNISNDEVIIFSIWHSGTFIACAIAIDEKLIPNLPQNNIKEVFENKLNLSGSIEEERLSIRDGYYWFDIKYTTDDEFLFNNIYQEQISRKIAHIVTVGLIASMELLSWKKK